MDTFIEVTLIALMVLAIIFGTALVLALPTMWLVNYLFSPTALLSVFGVTSIGLAKAFWLNVFFGIAFKSSSSSKSKNK